MSHPTESISIPAVAPTPVLYQRAWACWAAATLTSFAAIEAAALLKAPGHGTLTAQLRRRRALSAAAIAAFGIWAIHHIVWAGGDS